MSDKEKSSNQAKDDRRTEDPFEDFGFDGFPERDSKSIETEETKLSYLSEKFGFKNILTGGKNKQELAQVKCQQHVIDCIEKNIMVKLLISALKSRGCDFKPSRHASCEECAPLINGGYDAIHHQVVVCANNSTKGSTVCNVLGHELIHAFDFCRAKADFTNTDHLACTEIRAANIMHCTMGTAATKHIGIPLGKKQQEKCVKWKARNSVLAVRNITKEEADAAIDRVFDKCYADLEPVGRIPHNPQKDARRHYVEASLYGYTEL